MDFLTEPMDIEHKSMSLIAPYLDKFNLEEETKKVYSRLIHASGDVEYAKVINIHPAFINSMKEALLAGCDIYTDVEMVRTGINKKKLASWGGQVHCLIADSQVALEAKKKKITRSMAAMQHFGRKLDGAIIAIGNAPTALYEVLDMASKQQICPAAIIGIPVGFVGAADAKQALADNDLGIPYITVDGTKGGSPIAAAAVNAVMYLLDDSR